MKRARRCLFSVVAELDLEEISDYIARDNPERAVSFVKEIRGQCRKITAYPEAAPLHPELGETIRMVPFGRYLIFFTVQADHVRMSVFSMGPGIYLICLRPESAKAYPLLRRRRLFMIWASRRAGGADIFSGIAEPHHEIRSG